MPHVPISEEQHHYGPQVHLLKNPFLQTHLAMACSAQTQQPQLNYLIKVLYMHLLQIVINQEFPVSLQRVQTRMSSFHPQEAWINAEMIDSHQKVVTVNLARAGTLPSHFCFDALNWILNPENVRQDHLSIQRSTNDQGAVIGAQLTGHKIGGPVQDAIVLFPDPMGATGSTMIAAMNLYKPQSVAQKALKMIALHLIVTPEYIRNVLSVHPELIIYGIRLDRGLSPDFVLKSPYGKFWDQEKGLNEKDYIVPGGGGFGEVLNNAWI